MSRIRDQFLDCQGLDAEQLESFGTDLARWQKRINWMIGDTARAAKALLGPENYSQVFPPDMSPGLIQRCEAVSRAYPKESDRNPLASWSQHMREANHPDRIQRVQAHVDAGRNSDEAAKVNQDGRTRWLLAVDTNYFLHRFWFSGAGVEAAAGVASWVQRTAERLKEKGLTDVACCFDSHTNHRKELTAAWEDKYKDRRTEKDPELDQQITLVRQLLEGHGFACVSADGMEADDCLASFAKSFDGRVTLVTPDKDMRQCLSDKCNILLEVTWNEDEDSVEAIPDYHWVTAKSHIEGCTYNGTEVKGISPQQWPDFQAIAGDSVDNITGARGIGAKIACDLIREFGSLSAVLAAAMNGDDRIKEKKRAALVEFSERSDVTLKLVTMRTDVPLNAATRV